MLKPAPPSRVASDCASYAAAMLALEKLGLDGKSPEVFAEDIEEKVTSALKLHFLWRSDNKIGTRPCSNIQNSESKRCVEKECSMPDEPR